MGKTDKHGRTASSYRQEAQIIGAKIRPGDSLAQMRQQILKQAERNRQHNTEILRGGDGRWATGPDACRCH